MFPTRALLAVLVAVCIVFSGLAAAVPTAAAATASLVEEIETRDQLIADQEALLNVYRCMFAVDVAAVPGGCANGAPAQPAGEPGPLPPNPTKADKDARDDLIAAQENLLNAYRCNHNIDTQLVPGGCPEPVGDTSEAPDTTQDDNTDQDTETDDVEVTSVFDSEGNLCTTDWGIRPDGLCYTEDERHGACSDYPSNMLQDLDNGGCFLHNPDYDSEGRACQTSWGVRPDGRCYSFFERRGFCSDTPTNFIFDYDTDTCVWYESDGGDS